MVALLFSCTSTIEERKGFGKGQIKKRNQMKGKAKFPTRSDTPAVKYAGVTIAGRRSFDKSVSQQFSSRASEPTYERRPACFLRRDKTHRSTQKQTASRNPSFSSLSLPLSFLFDKHRVTSSTTRTPFSSSPCPH